MEYKASYDMTTKIITAGIIILLLTIAILPVFLIDNRGFLITLLISLVHILICIVTFIYSPRSYSIASKQITIHRIFKDVVFLREEIESYKIIDKADIKGTIRTFGVGGLFGYFGSFYNTNFGAMTWYLTRRDKLVLLITKQNKKILLSPDNPEDFIKAIA